MSEQRIIVPEHLAIYVRELEAMRQQAEAMQAQIQQRAVMLRAAVVASGHTMPENVSYQSGAFVWDDAGE